MLLGGHLISQDTAMKKVDEVFPDNSITPKPWEVADVRFGKADMSRSQYLSKLTDLRNEYLKNNLRIKSLEAESALRDKLTLEKAILVSKFETEKDKYLTAFPDKQVEDAEEEQLGEA
jgi:hypothetical protein